MALLLQLLDFKPSIFLKTTWLGQQKESNTVQWSQFESQQIYENYSNNESGN